MYGNRYPELLLLGVTTILSEDLVKVADPRIFNFHIRKKVSSTAKISLLLMLKENTWLEPRKAALKRRPHWIEW
jgi:hypothetical protein